MSLIFNPAIPLLEIYPEDTTPTIKKFICPKLFMVTSFIVKTFWKLPTYSSIGG